MSNTVNIKTTEFRTDLKGHLEVTFGFRVYDGYGQTYCNLLDSLPEDDFDILRAVLDNTDHVSQAMIDYVKEHETGISVNDTWYDYDEIKEVLASH